ncbi:MAG: ABC transporter substrate-binding protein [Hyphomicrobiaceae bacterium]|nr:MAG: ABC transporter substrate-binding protein [Hyphomicrobiaceae bacterium]
MNTMALVLWSALMAVFGLVTANVAQASELKVLTSVALTSVLDELAPVFEKTTGTKLKIDYNLIAAQRKRILDGESADVIILSRGAMQELQKQDKFAASDLVDVAGTPVSVAARAGVPKPDISTVDALKQTLLSARSIVYADPAKGGASGVYFARVLDRLGIAEQMQAKTILVPGAQAAEVVAKGEAELGVAQGSEIVPVAGAQLVGPLPGEFASMTVFTAGIGAGSTLRAPASELITFLKGPEAAARFKAKGFEPG